MSLFPFGITNDGTLCDYYNNTKVIDLSFCMNIKRIAKLAFRNCSFVEEIILPGSVEVIENMAFNGCYNLKTINIPNDKTVFEGNPFYNTKWEMKELKEKGFIMINNCLIKIDQNLTDDSVIKSAKRIGRYAFKENKFLKAADLSQWGDLEYIETFSFNECSNLETVILSDKCKVRSVNIGTFASCPKLKELTLPPSIENINGTAFDKDSPWFSDHKDKSGQFLAYGDFLIKYLDNRTFDVKRKKHLTLIDLNKYVPNVKVICSNSFVQSGIKKIYLSNNITTIMPSAFDYCINLNEVVFPSSIKHIKPRAFNNCENFVIDRTKLPLTAIVYPST